MWKQVGRDVSITDIQQALADGLEEDRGLDWKRELGLDKKGGRDELAKDAAAMANAAGGVLVYGVDEARTADGEKTGVPRAIPGCKDFNDSTKQRIESILTDLISPRLPLYDVEAIPGGTVGSVVVIRVGRSWVGPHMVRDRFYSRTSAGNYRLSVDEVRRAFVSASSTVQELERFRTDRLGRVLSRATTYPLAKADADLIVHLLSVAPSGESVSFRRLRDLAPLVPLLGLCRTSVEESRSNMEGMVFTKVYDECLVPSFTQVFRDGGVEGATSRIRVYEHSGRPAVDIKSQVEQKIRAFLAPILREPDSYGLAFPLFAAVSIVGLLGYMPAEATDALFLEDPSPLRYRMDRNEFVPRGHVIADVASADELATTLSTDVRRGFGLS